MDTQQRPRGCSTAECHVEWLRVLRGVTETQPHLARAYLRPMHASPAHESRLEDLPRWAGGPVTLRPVAALPPSHKAPPLWFKWLRGLQPPLPSQRCGGSREDHCCDPRSCRPPPPAPGGVPEQSYWLSSTGPEGGEANSPARRNG